MANRYVYSGAAGAGTGADWANAHTTLALAITAGAAGDVYYVAHDHAESTAAAITLTFKGTTGAPDRILCVNRAGSVPPVAADLMTTATVTTTGDSAITLQGFYYAYGITFQAGSGGTGTANILVNVGTYFEILDNCGLYLLSTGTGSRIQVNASSGATIYRNCAAKFNNVNQAFSVGQGRWEWTGGGMFAAGSAIPTTLFAASGAFLAKITGTDLSSLGSGKTIVSFVVNPLLMQITNCKLGASVTIAPTLGNGLFQRFIDVIGCHSSSNVARNERYSYQGTLTTETTIVRTGGASDGTTPYSWKVAATAENERDYPFETFEGAVWNTTTGSAKTLTVHTVTDGVTLTDAEIWIEVEYLGDATAPVVSLITDANATVLTTAANQAASTETWTTTGLTTPVKQKLEVTFTPQMAGPIRWRVKVAKVSATVYICPKAEIS